MSWNSLARLLQSDHFRKDPSFPVAYLFRYAHHVGLHYNICLQLRQFSFEQIEFYIPQLCHLIISIDNESMALEEYIIELCENSVMAALTIFWLIQAYLSDFSANPHSASFRTCQRVYNKVQGIIFGDYKNSNQEKIKENVGAMVVLAGIMLGGALAPFLPQQFGPLALAQARRPRPVEREVSQAVERPGGSLVRSNTIASSRVKREAPETPNSPVGSTSSEPLHQRPRSFSNTPIGQLSSSREPTTVPKLSVTGPGNYSSNRSVTDFSTHSVSNRSPLEDSPSPALSNSSVLDSSATASQPLSREEQIRLLRSNYFQNQTQLFQALEQISVKLVSIPKPARLSALRAELALINNDLPADVDIPLISPPTLVDGDASRSRHHRIVRISPAEATSLNSAERVPYLLMIEVLRDDLDFDPSTSQNEQLLATLLSSKRHPRRLFDLSSTSCLHPSGETIEEPNDSVFEPMSGDLANTMLKTDEQYPSAVCQYLSAEHSNKHPPSRQAQSGSFPAALSTASTPRNSDMELSRSGSPYLRSAKASKLQGVDNGVGALATHMRIAAQMLAQLESSTSRPKAEVDAIQARIIASMQSLEDHSFDFDESIQPGTGTDPTIAPHTSREKLRSDSIPVRVGGADRMENDQKTGGVRQVGDRDDPSYKTFGEEWSVKKERIRRTSPYGNQPNWDLVSVIVKTGADLRQEAFACQLIQECHKIWSEAKVDVWVKQMKILVTGDNSGLIETISNGVSLHSIKRSLTLSRMGSSVGAKRRFATLKDHFDLAFGEESSPAHQAAVEMFARSLAAYSIISYIFQLKDRHNGNILIDNAGHIIHIDFGFMLSNSPGSMGFEAAPFKLTQEYVDVLGGVDSPAFGLFRTLCRQAFLALRKRHERLTMLIELMGQNSTMPCFGSGIGTVLMSLRMRLGTAMTEEDVGVYVDELIAKSNGSYYTRMYDAFQYRTQGIY